MDKFKLRKISTFISFAGASANKVDKVVDIVLEQIAGIQVDWLPKSTLAKDMAIESRGVAQYQIASGFSKELYQYDTSL